MAIRYLRITVGAQRMRGEMQVAGTLVRAVRSRSGWDWVGAAISIAIVAAAFGVLVSLLRDVEIARVLSALSSTSWLTILVAALLIAGSYLTLTGYEYFALRAIGCSQVPYRVAALTGFMSYTIGHNLGATVLTGGAVRFRVYKGWGLTLLDVAKVAFISGLTFWLGNAVVLGVGITVAPDVAGAINQLPAAANRGIGLAILAVVTAYLLWLMPRPRRLGRNGWQVTLPNAKLTLVQIALGVADLGLAALGMYVLIAGSASVDLLTALGGYVVAALLGFASHAPGSLGVFDAAMLLALPTVEKEVLLAALLIFRCLYYLVPFGFAIAAFCLRELWLARTRGA